MTRADGSVAYVQNHGYGPTTFNNMIRGPDTPS